jgi:ABC-type histidine transport system ATPase subunit
MSPLSRGLHQHESGVRDVDDAQPLPVSEIRKQFGHKLALDDVTLSVRAGEVVAIPPPEKSAGARRAAALAGRFGDVDRPQAVRGPLRQEHAATEQGRQLASAERLRRKRRKRTHDVVDAAELDRHQSPEPASTYDKARRVHARGS